MEHHIGALPRTPFPASRDFPSRGNERYEGKNRESYISCTIPQFPPLVASAASQSAELVSCDMIQKRNCRNADFISIALRAIRNPRPERPSNLRTFRPSGRSILRTFLFTTLRHNPPPSGGHNPRGEAPSTFPSEPFEPFHWKMLISSQNYLISINQGGFHHEVHIFRTCML